MITRHNYGQFLPSESDLIAQGRDFAEAERTAEEVANILFPEIESLRAKVAKMEEQINSSRRLNKALYEALVKVMSYKYSFMTAVEKEISSVF